MAKISQNALLVYNKLLELGVKPGTASGAVGSLMGESGSGLNTAAINRGDGADSSDSIGAGQWNSNRAKALKNTAAEMGVPWTDIRAQVAHIGNELNGSHRNVLKSLLAAGDSVSAGNAIWTREYEIPADASGQVRARLNRGLTFAGQVGAMSPEQIQAITAQTASAPAEPRSLGGRGPAPTVREMTSGGGGNFGMGGDPLAGMIALGGPLRSEPAPAQLASADPAQADALTVRALGGGMTPGDAMTPGGALPSGPAPMPAPIPAAPIEVAQAAPANPYGSFATPVITAAPQASADANPYGSFASPVLTGQSGQTPTAAAQYRFDDTAEAPARLRFEVEALSKPEDQLAALRKHYPTAQPYDGDNFIYQAENGTWQKFNNNKGWWPSRGDFAGALPSFAEALGGAAGAFGGGLAGAAAGPGAPLAVPAGAMAGAAVGGTAAREAAQRGANWFFGNDDTRTTGEQLGDAAMTAGANAIGEGAGRLVAKGLGAAGRSLGFGTPAAAEALTDMRALGIDPSVGMVTGNMPTQYLERGAAAYPVMGSGLSAKADDAMRAIGRENDRILGAMASTTNPQAVPATAQEVGALLKGAAGEAQERFRATADANYGAVGALTGGVPAQGGAMGALGAELAAEVASLSAFGARTYGSQLNEAVGMVAAINKDIADGASFDTLKTTRTQIGKMMRTSTNDAEQGYLARMYDGLTEAMGSTADSAGNGARAAWEGADAAFRAGVEKGSPVNVKENLAPILRAAVDEDVLSNMLQGSERGGSRIAAARRQIVTGQGNETWDAFQTATIERLGSTPEGFNANKFMKGWQGMADEAKDALFAGTSNAAYRSDLDRLARVAAQMKRYGRSANHSNTANVGVMMAGLKGVGLLGPALVTGTFSTLGWAGAAAATTGLAIKGADKLLTSPRVVSFIAGLPRSEVQRGGVQRTVDGLIDYAATPGLDMGFRQSVTELARSIEEAHLKKKKKK